MEHLNSQSGKTFLSRRQVLKALIVLGGASTLSALPNKWETPVVEVGALPALAQISPLPTLAPTVTPSPPTSSPTPGPTSTPGACSDNNSPATISNLSVSKRLAGCNPGGGEPGDLFTISLAYSDPCGLTPNQASMRLAFEFLPSQFTETEQSAWSGEYHGRRKRLCARDRKRALVYRLWERR